MQSFNVTTANQMQDVRIEYWFLPLFVIFGLLFLVLTPPFQVPDEGNHVFRAYQLSQGHVLAERRGDSLGGEIPTSLVKQYTTFRRMLNFKPGRRVNMGRVRHGFSIPLNPDETRFVPFLNTGLYSPVPYLPQALAIGVGRLFNPPPLVLLYLARLANFAMAIVCMTIVLRLMPIGKLPMLLLMLMPQTMYQLASASQDVMAISLSYMLIALLLRAALIDDGVLSTRYLAGLFVVSLLLGPCKSVYTPMVFLYFFIPISRVGTRRKYFTFGAATVLCSFGVAALWQHQVERLYVPLRPGCFLSLAEAKTYILEHPIEYTRLVVRSFIHRDTARLRTFMGHFGWLDTRIPVPALQMYGVIMVAAALRDGRANVRFAVWRRGLMLLVFAMGGYLVATALFMLWKRAQDPFIPGISGRYFIPIAPLVLLLFYNRRLNKLLTGRSWMIISTAAVILTLSVSLYALCQRFYG